eukprot:6204552-Pleurochrysis_carterae.AAC.2
MGNMYKCRMSAGESAEVEGVATHRGHGQKSSKRRHFKRCAHSAAVSGRPQDVQVEDQNE